MNTVHTAMAVRLDISASNVEYLTANKVKELRVLDSNIYNVAHLNFTAHPRRVFELSAITVHDLDIVFLQNSGRIMDSSFVNVSTPPCFCLFPSINFEKSSKHYCYVVGNG